MTKILSIGTATPKYRHHQEDILRFMQRVYAMDEVENRKLTYLYHQSGIDSRYSVMPDYSVAPPDWKFYPASESLEPFPDLEKRMNWFQQHAATLSLSAIRKCVDHSTVNLQQVTHLITVSCTGMSAPGLELELIDLLGLSRSVERSSINFMGCYAALHALKQADAICRSAPGSLVLVVCTELCTIHFQKLPTPDNIASSLLFGDGAAAMIISSDPAAKGISVKGFYGEVVPAGKKDMRWELSSSGFLMTLSSYIPELLNAEFLPVMQRAFERYGISQEEVAGWCVHPGGKRILQVVEKCLKLPATTLAASYSVLQQFGNMSSPTILFVLQDLMNSGTNGNIIGAAFGPGLTMETCWLEAGDL